MAVRIRLRDLLSERGMTQVELQARTGLAYSTINDLFHEKSGRIELATLDVLCAMLRCRVGDVLEYVAEGKGRRS